MSTTKKLHMLTNIAFTKKALFANALPKFAMIKGQLSLKEIV